MTTSVISPQITIIESDTGVCYRLRYSKGERSQIPPMFVMAVLVPVFGAVLAGYFLAQIMHRVSWFLSSLSVLFVVQMLFVARLPWNLVRQRLWRNLVIAAGYGEVRLHNDRLFVGNRLGIFRSVRGRDIQDLERLVVFVRMPPDENASAPVEQTAVLAVEVGEDRPWLLVDGFSKGETMALAEDLHARLLTARQQSLVAARFPQPAVLEADDNFLYPPVMPDLLVARKPWWLAVNVGGAIGLGALMAAAMQTGATALPIVRASLVLGGFLEMLLLVISVYLCFGNAVVPKSDQESQV